MPRYWVDAACARRRSAAGSASLRGRDRRLLHELHLAKRFSKDKESFGRAASRGCVRSGRRRRMPPALPRFCRCSRSDSGLGHGGDPARRPDGMGEPGAAPVRRAQGLRLGPDRFDVSRQRGRLVLVLTTVRLFAAVLRVPFSAIAPMIVVSCAIGPTRSRTPCRHLADAPSASSGYVFKEDRIPLAPFTLALVLGSRAEDSFRLSDDRRGAGHARVLVRTAWSARSPRSRSCCSSGR